MIKEKTKEEILNAIAPCSMFCSTCTGCKYGKISYHSKELLYLLEGHEEFLDKNLKRAYLHKLEEFKEFKKMLKKYASPKCGGCRKGGATGCSIKGCIIPQCVKDHHVSFCAECSEFPCNKIHNSLYKSTVIEKWFNGNKQMKKYGIEKYYEENKNKPHYIDYIEKKKDKIKK